MSPKNEDIEQAPTTPESADATPKKRAAKSTVKAPAKSAARTRTASSSAASEKTEKPAPRRRASTSPTSTTADPSAKGAPRLRPTISDSDVAATETFATSATSSALDAHDDAAISRAEISAVTDGLRYIEDEVRVHAYMLSLARGDRPGSPDTDWFQAEREVAQSRQL